MALVLGAVTILAGCSNGGENGGGRTAAEETDVIESSPSRPGASDDELAAMYVEDLYGVSVTSLEDAGFFISDFWFEVWDNQLVKLEELGYDPFTLRPGCLLAAAYPRRHVRVTRASSFESLIAEETLLTEIVQLTQENADQVVEGQIPPDIDRAWCDDIEDELQLEYSALPPP